MMIGTDEILSAKDWNKLDQLLNDAVKQRREVLDLTVSYRENAMQFAYDAIEEKGLLKTYVELTRLCKAAEKRSWELARELE